MANITDKTVKSKYPPKDTNVTWIDTSSKPYVSRSYINGSWEVVGGGVTDYNDIKNKPTINGVELDGNKTSSELGLATSQQGTKADTAYQKPSSGIPQSDLSSDVQSQLNKHFKGWYTSSSALPSNPVVGDYAYVKGAESTDPAAIYECTIAGTWSDSGRTADTSNVQTFASGEEVNEFGIDSNLLSNRADYIPTSAVVEQFIPKEKTYVTPSYTNGYITSTGSIGSSSQYGYVAPIALGVRETIYLNNGNVLYHGSTVAVIYLCDVEGDFVSAIVVGDASTKKEIYTNTTNETIYIGICGYISQLNYYIEKNEVGEAASAAIKDYILSESFTVSSVTRDSAGNVTAATIKYPDGVSGTLAIIRDSAGNVTQAVFGYGTDTYTLIVTRDANDYVTATNLTKN